MDDLHSHEEQELAIDTVIGLRTFVRHGAELHKEVCDLLGDMTLSSDGREAFRSMSERALLVLQSTAAEVERHYEQGRPVTPTLLNELQTAYDDIGTVYDAVVEQLSVLPTNSSEQALETSAAILARLQPQIVSVYEEITRLLTEYEEIKHVSVGDSAALALGRQHYQAIEEVEHEVAAIVDALSNTTTVTALFEQDAAALLVVAAQTLKEKDAALDRLFEVVEPQVNHAALVAPSVTKTKETPARSSEFSSYIMAAQSVPRYRNALKTAFPSLIQFEHILRRAVAQIENPSQLDSFLGVRYPSAFYTFLKDMPLSKLVAFDAVPRAEIRAELITRGIPYETYVLWLDAFYDMLTIVEGESSLRFGDLFVRAEIELLIDAQESLGAV